jgi:hypothetical protein
MATPEIYEHPECIATAVGTVAVSLQKLMGKSADAEKARHTSPSTIAKPGRHPASTKAQ